jgi:hypothetical protein
MPFVFSRIPAAVWSGILAFVLTIVTGGVWTVLLSDNLAISPAIPWAVVVMALLLWLMWQYLGGRWGPQSTSQARRRLLRARPLPRQVFAWAVVAGVLAIVALVGYWIVLVQLVKTPPACPAELLQLPGTHRDARAGDGLAGFLPGRGSRVPGVLSGHSGTSGERPARYRDCGSGDCTGPRPDAGVRVACPAVVFLRGRDVGGDGLPH